MTAIATVARGVALSPRLRTLIVVVVTALAIAAGAWFVNRPSSGVTAINIDVGPGGAPAVGTTPPDFQAKTVDGKALQLSAFAGQPVWLTFGASWCADCRAEAVDLEATYSMFREQGLVVVGVFIQEDDAAVKEYAARMGFTFTMTADPDTRLAAAYHILGIPTHYFIGRDGRIREIRIGGLKRDEMARLVRELMA
jgi:cytochrome c biogenesis protein CcmG, thiol:disulfide interchange protein DsbE